MATPLRVEYPGALYHVTSHGNKPKKIFHAKSDYAKLKLPAVPPGWAGNALALHVQSLPERFSAISFRRDLITAFGAEVIWAVVCQYFYSVSQKKFRIK